MFTCLTCPCSISELISQDSGRKSYPLLSFGWFLGGMELIALSARPSPLLAAFSCAPSSMPSLITATGSTALWLRRSWHPLRDITLHHAAWERLCFSPLDLHPLVCLRRPSVPVWKWTVDGLVVSPAKQDTCGWCMLRGSAAARWEFELKKGLFFPYIQLRSLPNQWTMTYKNININMLFADRFTRCNL